MDQEEINKYYTQITEGDKAESTYYFSQKRMVGRQTLPTIANQTQDSFRSGKDSPHVDELKKSIAKYSAKPEPPKEEKRERTRENSAENSHFLTRDEFDDVQGYIKGYFKR